MRLRTFAAAALLTCGLGSAASAQVVFTGKIEPATLASICQEETHVLTCTGLLPGSPTGVLLKSSSLDLDAYVGKVWKFTAFPRGVECPVWDVVAVAAPTATLTFCGSPTPGCPVRFRVGPSGVLGVWALFVSGGPDFAPVSPTAGTILIAPPGLLFAAGYTTGDTETLDFTIPPDVSLTGASLWWQGVRRDIGPIGPLELTNAACWTITGPSPPCILPDC